MKYYSRVKIKNFFFHSFSKNLSTIQHYYRIITQTLIPKFSFFKEKSDAKPITSLRDSICLPYIKYSNRIRFQFPTPPLVQKSLLCRYRFVRISLLVGSMFYWQCQLAEHQTATQSSTVIFVLSIPISVCATCFQFSKQSSIDQGFDTNATGHS